MAKTSVEPKFSLRLIVDEEKKKVVLAEACRDFVDVLFSLLTLPMGTIVRLLEKHRNSKIGCFGNLYKSVVDMSIDDFETEACKQVLLNPRSVKEVKFKRLKLNMNPNDDLKYFHCPSSCLMFCSNFSTTRCRCGKLMNKEIQVAKDDHQVVDNIQNGVFVRGRSSFIITDDLKVEVRSTEIFLKKVKSQGYDDIRKLHERLLDIGFEEVMTLLLCIFSSNDPLTDAFLNKSDSRIKSIWTDGLSLEKKEVRSKPEKVVSLKAIVRKHDLKILYVECGEDFVDLLFTFLAIPLESVLEISGNNFTVACIRNLFKSYNDMRATSKSAVHHYYRYQKQLLNIITEQPPLYYRYRVYNFGHVKVYGLTTNCNRNLDYSDDKVVPVVLIDPKSHGRDQLTEGSGFMKRDTKFTVSNDLIIRPMNSSSTFRLLRKLSVRSEDLEVQEICISKTEATSLLGAALVTSSALNSALWNLIAKKPKEET